MAEDILLSDDPNGKCYITSHRDVGKYVSVELNEWHELLNARDALSAGPDKPAKAALLHEIDKLRGRIAKL